MNKTSDHISIRKIDDRFYELIPDEGYEIQFNSDICCIINGESIKVTKFKSVIDKIDNFYMYKAVKV